MLAHPTARATSATALRTLNRVRICFMVFRILALVSLGEKEKLVRTPQYS